MFTLENEKMLIQTMWKNNVKLLKIHKMVNKILIRYSVMNHTLS